MDWGVVRFFTLSDGQHKEQCAPLKKFLPQLAKLQRRMARKKKFSQNWKKAKARITKLHSRIANIRKDFVHKASNDISKNHAIVCVEDLQVKNMSASAAGMASVVWGVANAMPPMMSTGTRGKPSSRINAEREGAPIACAVMTSALTASERMVMGQASSRMRGSITA